MVIGDVINQKSPEIIFLPDRCFEHATGDLHIVNTGGKIAYFRTHCLIRVAGTGDVTLDSGIEGLQY